MDGQNKLPIEMSQRENAILNGRSSSRPSGAPHCYLAVDAHGNSLGRDPNLTWCLARAKRQGTGAKVINCETGEVVHVE